MLILQNLFYFLIPLNDLLIRVYKIPNIFIHISLLIEYEGIHLILKYLDYLSIILWCFQINVFNNPQKLFKLMSYRFFLKGFPIIYKNMLIMKYLIIKKQITSSRYWNAFMYLDSNYPLFLTILYILIFLYKKLLQTYSRQLKNFWYLISLSNWSEMITLYSFIIFLR